VVKSPLGRPPPTHPKGAWGQDIGEMGGRGHDGDGREHDGEDGDGEGGRRK
jgi:hypothetical protein